MKREQLSDLIGNIDDMQIAEAYRYDFTRSNFSRKGKHSMNKHTKLKKRVISFPLVAALILLIGAAAFAIGAGIHHQRQQELRDHLKIEENAIADYEENILDEVENTQAEGVTLLSTINDGEFQRIYVDVCPVEPEIARSLWTGTQNEDGCWTHYEINFTVDNENFFIASYARLTDSENTDDIINAAYDEETQTLTVACACIMTGNDPVSFTVELNRITEKPDAQKPDEHVYDAEPVRTFGTVTVTPTASGVRAVRFETPYVFENDVTEGKGEVIGANINSFNIDILVTHDNMETMYAAETELQGNEKDTYLEEQQGWLQVTDNLAQSVTLTFSDGSSRTGLGVLRTYYENDMVVLHCGIGNNSINANELISISIGDTIVYKILA